MSRLQHRRFWWLAPGWAVVASSYLLFAPTVAHVTESARSSANTVGESSGAIPTSSSLLETEGLSAFGPLLVPVLLTTLPLLTRRPEPRRILGTIAALLLGIFCVLGLSSIGLFYVPSVMALVVAVIVGRSSSDELPMDAAA